MPYNLNIPGQASEYELRAIEIVAALLPPNSHMIEIGSLFGRSSYAWAKSCDPTVTVHCVDPWEGNQGVRAMEARLGITYGLEGFRSFTAECPNVEPHKGYSPRDFQDWTTPLDLYFEDAVHTDPILSQNIEFWSTRLKPSGILCGDDYRPRFPDVRAAAERMAERLGRRLQIVDFFWCLLPDEQVLPGADSARTRLDELAREYLRERQAAGPRFSIKPAAALTTLPKARAAPLEAVVTNHGAENSPGEDSGPPHLVAAARPHDAPDAPTTQVSEQPLGTDVLAFDVPVRVSLQLDLSSVPAGPVDLLLSLRDATGEEAAVACFPKIEVKETSADIGDFVSRGETAARAPDRLRQDDVVHAYRWILGREPEKLTVIESHMGNARSDPRRLRMNLIKSAEFGRQLDAAGLRNAAMAVGPSGTAPFDPGTRARKPLVFVHLPKTGGTTVHYHLQAGLDPDRICPQRHNDVLSAPAANLADRDLVSGHFDARVLHLIPDPALVTVFRDPGERLYSLYRHLRFTSPGRQIGADHDLAELARRTGFEAFLDEAAQRNPGAVDNVYVRAFGGTLPAARWERSAEPDWVARNATPSSAEWDEMVERAANVLALPGTRIFSFSNLTGELAAFLSNAERVPEEPIRHLKDARAITSETVGFTPVEIEDYAPNEALERLVRHDRRLMDRVGIHG